MAALPDGFHERVKRIADDVLFAHALEVDERAQIPPGHFGALADAGLFGIAGPVWAGGLSLDTRDRRRVREVLASGCLTTAFVWTQHQGVVRRLRHAPAALQQQWLPDLCAGRVRGGLVLAGLVPAPEPQLRIRPSHDGFTISGTAPAVSGWGHVDILLVSARRERADEIVYVLVEPRSPGLHVRPRALAALNGTQTVALEFHSVRVEATAIVNVEPLAPWEAAGDGVRANGAFAIGVADRCARLGDEPWMHDAVSEHRVALENAADGAELAHARAGAALLAHRLASYLVAGRGSSASRELKSSRTRPCRRISRRARALRRIATLCPVGSASVRLARARTRVPPARTATRIGQRFATSHRKKLRNAQQAATQGDSGRYRRTIDVPGTEQLHRLAVARDVRVALETGQAVTPRTQRVKAVDRSSSKASR